MVKKYWNANGRVKKQNPFPDEQGRGFQNSYRRSPVERVSPVLKREAVRLFFTHLSSATTNLSAPVDL
jgi:hypothetical protein